MNGIVFFQVDSGKGDQVLLTITRMSTWMARGSCPAFPVRTGPFSRGGGRGRAGRREGSTSGCHPTCRGCQNPAEEMCYEMKGFLSTAGQRPEYTKYGLC